MKLIADSGSTKTNWCLVENSKVRTYFDTEGYNPYCVNRQYIINSIYQSFPESIIYKEVREVNFYGAGCSASRIPIIEDVLKSIFKNASLSIESDLLAAARSLLGREPGFAAILGTGSNSCIYNGKFITNHIDSLGYILGDEGSGFAIGKKILIDYIRGNMDANLKHLFCNSYHLDPDEILDCIYTKPLTNRYCADFSKFLTHPDIDDDYAYNIVSTVFNDFFKNLVSNYPDYKKYTFNSVGSVGYKFKSILMEVALSHHMKPGRIISSVIEDLVNYHTNDN